jgi:hypothetical protein
VGGAGQYAPGSSISFNFPLTANVTPHFIPTGAAPPAGCGGTVTNPAASPGHLCVFARYNLSGATIGTPIVYDAGGNGFRYGALVYTSASTAGSVDTGGSWVVTAHT